MSNSPHRIRKLCCWVATNSQSRAFEIRQSLHDRWQDAIISAIENTFDELATGDRVIHIPKLELHLEVTSEEDFLEVLPRLIQEQLKERLPAMKGSAMKGSTVPSIQPEVVWQETTAQQNQFDILLHYLQTGSLPWQMSQASTAEITVDLKETCRQLRSQILNYLDNQPQTTAFYFRLLQLLPESESFVFVNALSERFSPEWRTAIAAFLRFVFDTGQSRLNQPTQWQLVATIMSAGLNPLQPLPRPNFSTPDFSIPDFSIPDFSIPDFSIPDFSIPDFRKIVDPVLSQAGIDRDAFFSSLPVATALLFQPLTRSLRPPTLVIAPFVAEDQETLAMGNEEVTRSPFNPDFNPDAIGQVENKDESSEVKAEEKAEAVLLQPNPDLPSTSASTQSIAENPITAPTDNEATRSPLNPDFNPDLSPDSQGLFENEGEPPNQEDETDLPNLVLAPSEEIASTRVQFPLFVNHAGLVLLHPFLSPLFEATGIKATNSNAIAPAHLSRAAALLHFLATGQAEVYEFELGLIKVLLGLEPETPLFVEAGLIQERDREEVEIVLQSAIRYWTIFKNTSIDGLRASFLQRPGLLRQTDNGWSLQIEHQSFDRLLEQLPWTLSIIKLSWMKYPLYPDPRSDYLGLIDNSASTQSISENPITAPTDNEATRSPLNPDAIGQVENKGEPPNQEDDPDLPNLFLAPSQEISPTGVQFPLFVNYAGLVLLHPFLSPLFEATGIKATNSNAIAPAHLSRAAALLHFLATGQAEVYEFELGLIKVLLGLEPETPLLVGAGLIQERDREEAQIVLQSTIRYWTILKNTSMDGLRTSFLQRPGLLRQTDNGWSLQIEHQSFDMLLEQLPWTLSIIKLSWMRYPLYTEWQTF